MLLNYSLEKVDYFLGNMTWNTPSHNYQHRHKSPS